MLTSLEERVLQFVTRYITDQGRAPTLEEIGAGVGLRSKGTVHRYVQSLIDKGHLQRGPRGWRSLRLAGESSPRTRLPLAGRIAAGRPIEAIPEREEVDVSALFAGPDRYVLEVKGDSMIEAGILDGDLVVIEHRQTAGDGDIVVALVDGQEATLMRLFHLPDGRIELRPENRAMGSLVYEPERVAIQGVLVGQFRCY